MNRSMSMMKNVQDICAELRVKFFGEEASTKDYKDSFVINKAIENFGDQPDLLMEENLTEWDQSDTKTSKSITFRSNCYEKLVTFAQLLQIPEAEVCRRILYFSCGAQDTDKTDTSDIRLSLLRAKVALLKSQIESSAETVNQILLEIEKIEHE